MADPLYELLASHPPKGEGAKSNERTAALPVADEVSTKYLSRLLSLHLSDITTTEPQSLAQASQSNLLSIQALSSRSHKTTTISSDQLSTLQESLPSTSRSIKQVREVIPALDELAVEFARTYAKPRDRDRDRDRENENATLSSRRESQMLSRQADKLQDILELPQLLSATIASAASASSTTGPTSTSSGANYSQALDLFAHIKRLQIIYPDSVLVRSVLKEAEVAMKDMTKHLVNSLRPQNIRLAAAIRTVGWLRRVAPELGNDNRTPEQSLNRQSLVTHTIQPVSTAQDKSTEEGSFGILFLLSRLATFLSMTEALNPLRDLADQETERRLALMTNSETVNGSVTTTGNSTTLRPQQVQRRPSQQATHSTLQGHQTERYLKRYIEIFREQSFSAISTYRNIFPPSETPSSSPLELPSALQSFPLHLIEILLETLQSYLPNITDPTARESLLMQVFYAANSLGRLGADFSMLIALLEYEGPDHDGAPNKTTAVEENDEAKSKTGEDPEWARVIKKHRVQAARLDAMASGQDEVHPTRESHDITVR